MPRRERNAERRGASQIQRQTILVVCGAERTEVDYFKGLRGRVESVSVDLVVLERPHAPHQVVAFARDYRGGKDFEERWCVLDVDNFEREGRKISGGGGDRPRVWGVACDIQPVLRVLAAAPSRLPDATRDRLPDIETVLREYVKDYDKTRLRFSDFAEGVRDAVERAKKIDPSGVEHEINPSTGMWRLVERIIE